MSDQPIPRDDPKEPVQPYRDPSEDEDFDEDEQPDVTQHRDYGDEDPQPLLGQLRWPGPDDFWP